MMCVHMSVYVCIVGAPPDLFSFVIAKIVSALLSPFSLYFFELLFFFPSLP